MYYGFMIWGFWRPLWESLWLCFSLSAALLLSADLPWSGAQQCVGWLGHLWLPSVWPRLWAAQCPNCHCYSGRWEGQSSREVSQVPVSSYSTSQTFPFSLMINCICESMVKRAVACDMKKYEGFHSSQRLHFMILVINTPLTWQEKQCTAHLVWKIEKFNDGLFIPGRTWL